MQWGLAHRVLAPLRAIGVDEIQYGRGHKYLTLVYQIDVQCTRLLWVGQERTVESFQGFFTMIGHERRRGDRVRLLGHVAALSAADRAELLAGAQHPGPFPHRGEDEQGDRRGARRRSAATGARRLRAGAEEVALVPAQAARRI